MVAEEGHYRVAAAQRQVGKEEDCRMAVSLSVATNTSCPVS
jgi:hypothetical protein